MIESADGGGMLPLVRLLQLASPTLPIGAYSYSQGLERMVEETLSVYREVKSPLRKDR